MKLLVKPFKKFSFPVAAMAKRFLGCARTLAQVHRPIGSHHENEHDKYFGFCFMLSGEHIAWITMMMCVSEHGERPSSYETVSGDSKNYRNCQRHRSAFSDAIPAFVSVHIGVYRSSTENTNRKENFTVYYFNLLWTRSVNTSVWFVSRSIHHPSRCTKESSGKYSRAWF